MAADEINQLPEQFDPYRDTATGAPPRWGGHQLHNHIHGGGLAMDSVDVPHVIPDELDQMSKQLDRLDQAFSDLLSRIGPVLSPAGQPIDPNRPGGAERAVGEVADRLRTQRNRLSNMIDLMQWISLRVEL